MNCQFDITWLMDTSIPRPTSVQSTSPAIEEELNVSEELEAAESLIAVVQLEMMFVILSPDFISAKYDTFHYFHFTHLSLLEMVFII